MTSNSPELAVVGYAIRESDQFMWAPETSRPFASAWRAVVYRDDAESVFATLRAQLQEQALQYLSDNGQWLEETGRLRAELEALKAAQAGAEEARWLPMHDAPRHRRFLASVEGLVRLVTYGKTSHVPMWGWVLVDEGFENSDFCEPDGWMELPAAITATGAGNQGMEP